MECSACRSLAFGTHSRSRIERVRVGFIGAPPLGTETPLNRRAGVAAGVKYQFSLPPAGGREVSARQSNRPGSWPHTSTSGQSLQVVNVVEVIQSKSDFAEVAEVSYWGGLRDGDDGTQGFRRALAIAICGGTVQSHEELIKSAGTFGEDLMEVVLQDALGRRDACGLESRVRLDFCAFGSFLLADAEVLTCCIHHIVQRREGIGRTHSCLGNGWQHPSLQWLVRVGHSISLYLMSRRPVSLLSSPSSSMIGADVRSRTAVVQPMAVWNRRACVVVLKVPFSRSLSASTARGTTSFSRWLSSWIRVSITLRTERNVLWFEIATRTSLSYSCARVSAFSPWLFRTSPPTSSAGPIVTTFSARPPSAMPPPPAASEPPPRNAAVALPSAAPDSDAMAVPVLAVPYALTMAGTAV